MKNEDEPENLKKHIHDLERKIIQLEEDLEKERNENKITWQQKKRLEKENKDLKKQLAQLLGSAPTLATSDKTAEAGGVPSSKTFYRRKDWKEREKPEAVNQDMLVMEEKNQSKTPLRCMSNWMNVRTAVHLWASPLMVRNKAAS